MDGPNSVRCGSMNVNGAGGRKEVGGGGVGEREYFPRGFMEKAIECRVRVRTPVIMLPKSIHHFSTIGRDIREGRKTGADIKGMTRPSSALLFYLALLFQASVRR